MDRRADNEAAVSFSDRQFRQALEVIVGLYDGASAETLYRDSIGCFESLIEISRNTDLTADFAARHNMDNKYLVDGANFVISKMHFNPENNFYLTLGLSRDVSAEEIRDRWKKLMLLYHPDRQEGSESWVSERAKKVNEAYSILKDKEKRQAFDRKLLDRALTGKAVGHPGKTERSSGFRRSRPTIFNREWDRKKKNIPKVLVGAYIIAALVFLGYIYIRDNADQLESSLSARDEVAVQPRIKTGSPEEKRDQDSVSLSGSSDRNEDMSKEDAAEAPPSVTPEPKKGKAKSPEIAHKAAQAGIYSAPEMSPAKNLPQEKHQNETEKISGDGPALKKVTRFKDPAAAEPSADRKAAAPEASSNLRTAPLQKISEAESGTDNSQISPPPAPGPVPASGQAQQREVPGITREEVDVFMDRYAGAYLKGDLRIFMTLFSKSVLENGKLHFTELHEAYRNIFSEKIDFYRLKNMEIVLNGQSADVSGSYELKRYAPDEGRWKLYSGKIRWKITKEKEELKIININYDL